MKTGSRLMLNLVLVLGLLAGCGGGSGDSSGEGTSATASEPKQAGFSASTPIDTTGSAQNRLKYASSPYLLMHADNPVNWYSWGPKAFKKARRENKPIFLSIGYSTCYWCHVMERKVFMDQQIARKMNKYFVNIKVDREQRPDVDRVYMKAVRIMTGGGGWPMSLFLTPKLKPFFGATYIPPKGRGRRPGFSELADRIHHLWQNQRQKLYAQAEKVTNRIRQSTATGLNPTSVNAGVMRNAYNTIKNQYDEKYAGFGKKPKFPQVSNLEFLLNYYKKSGTERARKMVFETLDAMARGGIYDHIGEGFHRYATDRRWRIPHFEKMLYNQAQMANIYLRGYRMSGNTDYLETARGILNFTKRKFYHPGGGFYSALNAESPPPGEPHAEAEEGAYYTWTYQRLAELLNDRQLKVFAHVYGIKKNGNVYKDPRGEFTGENILYIDKTPKQAAKKFGLSTKKVEKLLKKSEKILFEARKKRPEPLLDDKIILSWNGLMISAYANGYRSTENRKYLEMARQSAQYLIDNLYNESKQILKRRIRNGNVAITANLSDYAYFVQGLLDLYQVTDNKKWLKWAKTFTDLQIEKFYDADKGGFYDSQMAGESLLFRTKDYYDGARPSGNSVAVNNLARLYQLTGQERYLKKARETMRYFGKYLNNRPAAMPNMLSGISKIRKAM